MKVNLTGRIAYRFNKQLFRKPVIVLQVEVEVTAEDSDAYNEYPVSSRKFWRDAELTDFTELKGLPLRIQTLPFKDGGLVGGS